MKTPQEAQRLRLYVDESDLIHGRPVYEVVVEAAQRHGLAGATVFRGVLGYGSHHRVHTTKVLRLSEDLPTVVEIIDQPERIESFVAELDHLVPEGLATLEAVRVIAYRPGDSGGQEETGPPQGV